MTSIKICITLDYETWQPVPNGYQIDWYKDLFNSAEQWMVIAEKYNAKLTFFVEMAEYLWLKKNNIFFAKVMKNQIQDMVKRGHDVQLHLHPSWLPELGVSFHNNIWTGLDKNQRLHDITSLKVYDVLEMTKNELEMIVKEIDSNFKVLVFRAAKYQIQPSFEIVESLMSLGIYADSSVWKGGYSKEHFFDFRYAYHNHQPYFSSPYDVRYKDLKEESFLEIPIFSYKGEKWNLDFDSSSKMLSPLLLQLKEYGLLKNIFWKKFRSIFKKNVENLFVDPFVFTAIGHTKIHKQSHVLDDFFSSLKSIPNSNIVTIKDIVSSYSFKPSILKKRFQGSDSLCRIYEITQWCYEALDPIKGHEVEDPLEIIKQGYGLCAAYVAIMSFMCKKEGFNHRLWRLVFKTYENNNIDTHELLEVFIKNKWILVDPTINIVFPFSLYDVYENSNIVDEFMKKESTLFFDDRWFKRSYNFYASSDFYKKIFSFGIRNSTKDLFNYFTSEEFLYKKKILYKEFNE